MRYVLTSIALGKHAYSCFVLHQELALLQKHAATVQEAYKRDSTAAEATIQTLRDASLAERLEYERLVQTSLNHREGDKNLLEQQICTMAGWLLACRFDL